MSGPFEGGSGSQPASAGAAGGAAGPASTSLSPFIAPALLTDEQSAQHLGISVRTFHQLRAEPYMPRPIVLGPRLHRWSRAELDQAIASMPRQQAPAAEPLQLAKGRAARAKTTEVS